jgi:hypothetical protein
MKTLYEHAGGEEALHILEELFYFTTQSFSRRVGSSSRRR